MFQLLRLNTFLMQWTGPLLISRKQKIWWEAQVSKLVTTLPTKYKLPIRRISKGRHLISRLLVLMLLQKLISEDPIGTMEVMEMFTFPQLELLLQKEAHQSLWKISKRQQIKFQWWEVIILTLEINLWLTKLQPRLSLEMLLASNKMLWLNQPTMPKMIWESITSILVLNQGRWWRLTNYSSIKRAQHRTRKMFQR